MKHTVKERQVSLSINKETHGGLEMSIECEGRQFCLSLTEDEAIRFIGNLIDVFFQVNNDAPYE